VVHTAVAAGVEIAPDLEIGARVVEPHEHRDHSEHQQDAAYHCADCEQCLDALETIEPGQHCEPPSKSLRNRYTASLILGLAPPNSRFARAAAHHILLAMFDVDDRDAPVVTEYVGDRGLSP
jgi:hypothetical protein